MGPKTDVNRRETNTTSMPGARRTIRRLWPVPFAGAAAMAALLLLTPMAGATAVTTFSAPYTGGTAVHYRDPVSQGCGASLTVTSPAVFHLSSGVGTGAASARSTPCSTSDSQATYDGVVGVRELSFSPSVSGSYTSTAKWNITWNASAGMSAKAAAAGGQATVEIWLLVKVHDITGAKIYVGKTLFVVKKDFSTTASFSGGAAGALYSATLVLGLTAGHQYTVYAVMGFDVAAVIPQGSPAGAVATASVDLGSTGHGGTLNSITVA